jgi:flagellar hook-associated protein 1 FlgK
LNGALGGNFFTVPAAQALVSNTNTGTAAITAANTNVGALAGSDYRLSFNAGTWTLVRLTDNTTSTFAAFPQTVDGVTLTLASGSANNGDSFMIQPTRNGASTFSVAISDPALVAAAAPIRTASTVGNTGNATITPGTVNTPPPPNVNLQQTVTLTFTSATTFDVTGVGTGNPTGVAYTANGNITYNGWTTQINGTPRAGDSFTISRNTSGVADNRNALLLSKLQTTNTVANGTANYQSAYSQVVSSVGNRAREINVQSDAQTALVRQTTAAQQSFSGVNLDEEAANLIRFQQAYQASGRCCRWLPSCSTLCWGSAHDSRQYQYDLRPGRVQHAEPLCHPAQDAGSSRQRAARPHTGRRPGGRCARARSGAGEGHHRTARAQTATARSARSVRPRAHCNRSPRCCRM